MNNIDVREIREKLGITQDELAKKVGVSRNTIINYENGGVIPESKRPIFNNLLRDNNVIIGDNNISGENITPDSEIAKLALIEVSEMRKLLSEQLQSHNKQIDTFLEILKTK